MRPDGRFSRAALGLPRSPPKRVNGSEREFLANVKAIDTETANLRAQVTLEQGG
jgi:hypothetical protein